MMVCNAINTKPSTYQCVGWTQNMNIGTEIISTTPISPMLSQLCYTYIHVKFVLIKWLYILVLTLGYIAKYIVLYKPHMSLNCKIGLV